MPANSCDCPNPPGGTVTCSQGQLAICVVRNGVVRASCVTPPAGASEKTKMSNWILSTITGEYREPNSIIEPQMERILAEGRYETYNTKVTFRLIR